MSSLFQQSLALLALMLLQAMRFAIGWHNLLKPGTHSVKITK